MVATAMRVHLPMSEEPLNGVVRYRIDRLERAVEDLAQRIKAISDDAATRDKTISEEASARVERLAKESAERDDKINGRVTSLIVTVALAAVSVSGSILLLAITLATGRL